MNSFTLTSDISELPVFIARSVPRAFYFWQAVSVLVTLWLAVRLWSARQAIAKCGNSDNPVKEVVS